MLGNFMGHIQFGTHFYLAEIEILRKRDGVPWK